MKNKKGYSPFILPDVEVGVWGPYVLLMYW